MAERGSSIVVVALVLMMLSTVVVAFGHGASKQNNELHYEGVADIVALAGARFGESAARTIAEQNNATLLHFNLDSNRVVTVTINVGAVEMTSYAQLRGISNGQ